jgi:hypothetical protein
LHDDVAFAEFDRNSNYVLAGSNPVKKIQFLFLFLFLLCFIQKIRRISLDDITKNSVFVVVCLKNHKKYSHCWIYFVCDDIAYSLMK